MPPENGQFATATQSPARSRQTLGVSGMVQDAHTINSRMKNLNSFTQPLKGDRMLMLPQINN